MEWNISKGSGRCNLCERIVLEEEPFFSSLFLQDECFMRKDFCVGCWDKQNPETFFSFWRTRRPKKEEPKRRIVDNVVILNLFSRLEGLVEPWARNMQYVLALFLLRKKLLQLKGCGKDEHGDFMNLHYSEENKTYIVYNQNLAEEEVEKINSDILRLLDPNTSGQDALMPLEQPQMPSAVD